MKSIAADNMLNPNKNWDRDKCIVQLDRNFIRMPWEVVLIYNIFITSKWHGGALGVEFIVTGHHHSVQ